MKSSKKYGTVMSTSNIESFYQGEGENKAKFNRSSSVGPGMTTNPLNPTDRSRRALYESLPFISVYGMQYREQSIAKSLSRVSLADMGGAINEQDALLANVDVDEVVLTTPLMAAIMVAVMLMFLVGYNTGVMNAVEPVVFPGHSVTEWSLAVAVFAVGGPFGAVLAGKVSNLQGRSAAIKGNMWLFLAGGAALTIAPSIYWIIAGRVLVGFASGYASVIVPIYLGELAPPTLRGTLGTLTQFSMVIGILASNLLSFPLADESGWRMLLGVTAVLSLCQLMASPFIVESPRWLLSKDEYSIQASMLLKQLRGFRSDTEVQKEVDHIVQASRVQRLEGQSSAHGSGAVWDLITDPRVRLLVISFTVLHMAQQLSGINAVFYYSTSFFDGIVADPLVGTAAAGTVNVLATYAALKLMDRCGRVTLLLWSSGGMFLSCIAITASLLGIAPNYVALLGVMAFVSFFEIGLGPIPWLIVAEMFDAKYVATAMSIASQVNWAFNFVVGLGFPMLSRALGPWVFVPFAAVLAAVFLFSLLMLPETAGRTHQEIQRIINAPTAGKFRNNGMQFVVVEGVDLETS
ncbi:solute carrier family facilitated glucose transporter member 3 [Tribonema minus]|uniref:Hexose transporter 1 n=1 Tax=Tribonema minus TaxID=303371 RepID=A0A835ZG82_9STRA|nr:solute carrier family facilitated glucose transporter member 3 [Tribonema minus]